jgi:galactokinase
MDLEKIKAAKAKYEAERQQAAQHHQQVLQELERTEQHINALSGAIEALGALIAEAEAEATSEVEA